MDCAHVDLFSAKRDYADVGARTATEAVLELLAHPAAERVTVGSRTQTQRPAAARPWSANIHTLELLKEREVLGRRLFVVSFEAEHVRHGLLPMTILVRAERARGTWRARKMSGVGGTGGGTSEPRVQLGGSWGRHGFCGGGRVHAARGEVARVRLSFDNGVVLEDETDAGWVLFLTDRPVERPQATVELLDARGDVIASSTWPWEPSLPETLLRQIARD